MQKNLFGQQIDLQYNEQEFQRMMQESNQFFERQMNVERHNEQRVTDRMNADNRLTEKGLGARAQFLNQKFQL